MKPFFYIKNKDSLYRFIKQLLDSILFKVFKGELDDYFDQDAEIGLRIVPDGNTSTLINVGVKKQINPIIRNSLTMSPEFGVVPTISEPGLGFEKGELKEMNDLYVYPEKSFYSGIKSLKFGNYDHNNYIQR